MFKEKKRNIDAKSPLIMNSHLRMSKIGMILIFKVS